MAAIENLKSNFDFGSHKIVIKEEPIIDWDEPNAIEKEQGPISLENEDASIILEKEQVTISVKIEDPPSLEEFQQSSIDFSLYTEPDLNLVKVESVFEDEIEFKYSDIVNGALHERLEDPEEFLKITGRPIT